MWEVYKMTVRFLARTVVLMVMLFQKTGNIQEDEWI